MNKIDAAFQFNAGLVRERASYEPAELNYAELDYWTTEETFTHARQLAYAILPIDEVANQIAYEAMLAARLCRNKRRHHRKSWLSQNRYKKFGPTRALLHESQLV